MEGHLVIKNKKLLESNKKFWFVLGRERLEHYSHKDDFAAGRPPLGFVEMSDVLDVRVAHDQRNTLALIRSGQERLLLKVKDGHIYNWVGSIRERIFSAREGEDAVIREKKKKAVRRNTRTIGETIKMDGPVHRRISRSTNDLSRLVAVNKEDTSTINNILEVPRTNRSLPLTQVPKEIHGSPIQETSSPIDALRSRKFSNSMSSVFSGSSMSSRGSSGHSRKKPRLPVSGFTGRAFLAHEAKMVDNPGVITNEDFEYIVQAERAYGPNISVTDENYMDVVDGHRNVITQSEEVADTSRNVTFNPTEDVSLIESRNGRKKMKKEKKKVETITENADDTGNSNQGTQKNSKKFNFGWLSLRKRKKIIQTKSSEENSILPECNDITVKEPKDPKLNKTLENITVENTNQYNKTFINKEREKEEVKLLKTKTTESMNKESDTGERSNQGEKMDSQTSDKPVKNLETETILFPVFRESQIQKKSEEIPLLLGNSSDIVDSPAYMKRVRLTSVSSTNSRDSASSVSSGMKDKILKWKRESTKSAKAIYISNPLQLKVEENLENKDSSAVNKQIDKIAHEKLTSYNSIDKNEEWPDERPPPILPNKPLKFHINQLEKLLKGNINPPNTPPDKSEVMLLLDSLRVMQSLQAVSCQDPTPSPVYEVPRRCYD